MNRTRLQLLMLFVFSLTAAIAAPLTVTVVPPAPPRTSGFNMGTSRAPDGSTLTLDSRSLILNGKRWTPVMGEFHYSRYPENEWRKELLKMKAGGVDIVATYVFWIHHEEIEGQWDWSARRNLRRFIETARDAGLKAVVRCGPWCHGEVRNGGLPDWVLAKGWKTRSNDTNYLAAAKILYGEIAKQLDGLLWKDGGPVIGVQVENEFRGPAEHLLTLKQMARDAGLDVPLYTRTGWPELRTEMPFGEIVPLYGVYAEGFWDRELTPMPGRYWSGFHFSQLRTDANIANELLGRREARDSADVAQYPYLTCEIGGGMMNSYHRRILVYPKDVEATTLVKIGSGSTSPGYYMYHGGENPDGKLTTLMESQATGYWNDMPEKNYDFQTALGQYGEIRPQYHLLRRLHLFLHEWGPALAEMDVALPDQRPAGKGDVTNLRWCVRSDGGSGFVFVNNYQRLGNLPAKQDVQFTVNQSSGAMTFPSKPVTIPAAAIFFWPFNFDLDNGVKLAWASAQPVCALNEGGVRTVFFAETKGIPAEFAFDGTPGGLKLFRGTQSSEGARSIVTNVKPGRKPAMEMKSASGKLRIVLLNEADSLALWKLNWPEQERIFLGTAGLCVDGQLLEIASTNRAAVTVEMFSGGDGKFKHVAPRMHGVPQMKVSIKKIQSAGPLREIKLGKISTPVAEMPVAADFNQAAVWRVKLPRELDLDSNPMLQLDYVGDVARVTLNGKLLTDDFYNGNKLTVGLRRYGPEILTGDLRVSILPLQKDAPIYMADEARPDFGKADSVGDLRGVEIIPEYRASLSAK